MKKLVVSVLCIMIISLLCGCTFVKTIIQGAFNQDMEELNVIHDDSLVSYKVKQINAGVNPNKLNQEFYFDRVEDITEYIYRYSIVDGSIVDTIEVQDLFDYAEFEDSIFYVTETKDTCNFYRYDYVTKETTELLKDTQDIDWIFLCIYKDWLIYEINYILNDTSACFICPIYGDINKDSVAINPMFEENMSGEVYYLEYNGLTFVRRFDTSGYYELLEVKDSDTNQELMLRDGLYREYFDQYTLDEIICQEEVIGFFHGVGAFDNASDFTYQIKGDDEILPIGCLDYRTYKEARIQESKITVEDDKIIGLFSVSNDSRFTVDISQRHIRKDVLFQLDPITGESNVLYDTVDNWTRIIGYQEGVLYLLKDGQIYESTLEGEQLSVLFELPSKTDSYSFYWQGDYLFLVNETQVGVMHAIKVNK